MNFRIHELEVLLRGYPISTIGKGVDILTALENIKKISKEVHSYTGFVYYPRQTEWRQELEDE